MTEPQQPRKLNPGPWSNPDATLLGRMMLVKAVEQILLAYKDAHEHPLSIPARSLARCTTGEHLIKNHSPRMGLMIFDAGFNDLTMCGCYVADERIKP